MTRARVRDAPRRGGRPARRDAHHRDRLHRCVAFCVANARDVWRAKVREDEGAIADRLLHTPTRDASVRPSVRRPSSPVVADMAPVVSKPTMTRLTRELKQFRACPPPYAPLVHVDENKILDWHILIQGVPDSAYEDGWYVMKITFKPQYPFQAPAVSVLTPNGRFQTSTSICMSMTEWHQETWNPAWSVATIVTGFLSFMVTDESTTGGMRASEETRRTFARESVAWNASQKRIVEMFPEIAKPGALEELKYKDETKVTDAVEASVADANDDANAGVEDAVGAKKARVGASPGAKK